MRIKKNKFIIFAVCNIILLIILLLLAIPASKFLSKINFDDNELVKDQIVINPKAQSPKIIERKMQVKFVAEVDDLLNWDFISLQENISVKIGENNVIKYEGKNLSDKTITSTADFVASPESILSYLVKIECFCFTEQTLEPGESKIFTMVFYLDPALDSDSKLDDLKELVFTYQFSEYKS